MRGALKKHKILIINIFPLESFNGTIELKFKNPLPFFAFFSINSFVSTFYRPPSSPPPSPEPRFHSALAIGCLTCPPPARPSFFYLFALSQRRFNCFTFTDTRFLFIYLFISKRMQYRENTCYP